VLFNATADQSIDTWRWFMDGMNKDNNADNFKTSFISPGSFEVKVDAQTVPMELQNRSDGMFMQ